MLVSNSMNWYEELGIRPRFPRPPDKEIIALLRSTDEPTIFLRNRGQSVEIVVKFPLQSKPLPSKMKKPLEHFGITLSEAFNSVLWKKLERNTAWAELAGPAIEAYRQTWLHFFKLAYVGHFHPSADQWLKKIEQELGASSKGTHRGRKPYTQAEAASLRRRYNALLKTCRSMHFAVKQATSSVGKVAGSHSSTLIKRAICDKVRQYIHAMPGDAYIFSGEAFKELRYKQSRLDDPQSWKPHQLAISLLAIERMQAYQTIEKKIRPTKRKNVNRT